MSSANIGENPMLRNPKVSSARLVHGGESGPKVRLKSVVDGQQVNIPVLIITGIEGRKEAKLAGDWLPVQVFEMSRTRENSLS